MKVTGLHERAGAFLQWGLQKDLLLPFREMEVPVRDGQSLVVAVCLDERTDRIYASSRLREHTSGEPPEFAVGDKVEVLLAKRINFGHFCIVAGTHHGLLNHDHAAVPLKSGDKIKAYVHEIFPDGHVDLRLDPANFKGVPSLKSFIVQELEANKGRMNMDNGSPAIAIREKFGVSKNNFKLALASLYKERKIRFLNPGIELIEGKAESPVDDKRTRR
jgi:predicted RNA-binding protein (virulence factor B family)